jgi:hypothetical protein
MSKPSQLVLSLVAVASLGMLTSFSLDQNSAIADIISVQGSRVNQRPIVVAPVHPYGTVIVRPHHPRRSIVIGPTYYSPSYQLVSPVPSRYTTPTYVPSTVIVNPYRSQCGTSVIGSPIPSPVPVNLYTGKRC